MQMALLILDLNIKLNRCKVMEGVIRKHEMFLYPSNRTVFNNRVCWLF